MRPFRVPWFCVFALIASLGLAGTIETRAAPAMSQLAALPASSQSLLYVANYLSNRVTEYALPASGAATPFRAIGGPHTGLHHPFGIALDRRGRLYVVNSEYPESITIYAPHAAGDATPACAIAGPNTGLAQPLWIAIDDAGALFVTNAGPVPYGRSASVRVFAPGACGNVAPIRVIAGQRTLLRSPGGIAFDASGDIVVASSDGTLLASSAGLVFPHYANGNVPARVFGGSDSGLALPFGLASIPMSHGFWVANPGNSSVVAYTRSSGRDLDPVRIIAGPRTGMHADSVTGVALDAQLHLYVSNRYTPPTLDTIDVFENGASGNAVPQAVIGGPQAQLYGPGGMVVGAE